MEHRQQDHCKQVARRLIILKKALQLFSAGIYIPLRVCLFYNLLIHFGSNVYIPIFFFIGIGIINITDSE